MSSSAYTALPAPPQPQMNRYQALVIQEKLALLARYRPQNVDLSSSEAPQGARPLVMGPTNLVYPNPGAAEVTLFAYQVPSGQRARIRHHALQHNGGNPPELSGSGVIFSFRVNGAPLKGLGQQFAQIGSFATPAPVVIWLDENDLFQVFFSIPAGNNPQQGSAGYRIEGWTASKIAQGVR